MTIRERRETDDFYGLQTGMEVGRAALRQPKNPTYHLPFARAKTLKVGGRCFSRSVALLFQ